MLESRLQQLNKSSAQLHEIRIEMEADCTKEIHASARLKKAKRNLIASLLIGGSVAVFSILQALGVLFTGDVPLLFYLIVGATLLIASSSLREIRSVHHRKKRRNIKWKNWS